MSLILQSLPPGLCVCKSSRKVKKGPICPEVGEEVPQNEAARVQEACIVPRL